MTNNLGMALLRAGHVEAAIERLQQPLPYPLMAGGAPMSDPDLGDVQSNLTKPQFLANVEQAKEYIRAGDIFQVVLSQRFSIETEVDPLHVYRVLRSTNPSPYSVMWRSRCFMPTRSA